MKKFLSKEVDLGLTNKGLVRKDPKETKTNKLAGFTNYLTEHDGTHWKVIFFSSTAGAVGAWIQTHQD